MHGTSTEDPRPITELGYSVSRQGTVTNTQTGRNLHPYIADRTGHVAVDLPDGRHYVHVLVAEAYIPRPQGSVEVRHLNNIPTDNRVENLAWGTRSDNVLDLRSVRTHCPAGHEYTSNNTYEQPNGWRRCRTCRREAKRASYQNDQA